MVLKVTTFEPKPGADIWDVIQEASWVAKRLNTVVEFEHNGINIKIGPRANPENVYKRWKKKDRDRS